MTVAAVANVDGPHLDGLDRAAVEQRIADGQTNQVDQTTSRTVGEIVRANVFTRFNAILGSLLVVILVVGPLQDALFGIVLVLNTAIGVVQELRAKRTLDRLALLGASRARVVRAGEVVELDRDEVVLDELLRVGPGDELVVDGVVVQSTSLEVDESLLSGESEPVPKPVGAEVLSGSYVSGGSAHVRATRIGRDAYAARYRREAQRFDLVRSELRAGIDRILRHVTWLLVPVATLLVVSQTSSSESLADAVRGSVAGVGSMIPEGLVLLTSVAFAVGAVRLGRQRVLLNELAAIEGLARVDVVCLDKTGTLTTGRHVLGDLVRLADGPAESALGALAAADPAPNSTAVAIAGAFPDPGWVVGDRIPFASDRKWSGITTDHHGTWVLGAPDVLLGAAGGAAELQEEVDRIAASGRRVVLLGTAEQIRVDRLPVVAPAALLVLEEQIRPDAAATLTWLAEQDVSVRVLSGDHPSTVGTVARRVGLTADAVPVDARRLPEEPRALAAAMEQDVVFGRVTPLQKRDMVRALQARGHTVAMIGDGVNDVLALKDADLGIAMGSGSAATRAVSRVVLLDDAFAQLPSVLAEGRRVIANTERVANLFLTKTVYATLLAVAVGVAQLPFPFYPRHLTIVSSLTIGVPAFFLALAPNAARARPGFVNRVLRFAVPAGTIAAAATFAAYAFARRAPGVDVTESRTTATIVLFVVALWVLGILSRPYTTSRRALLAGMVAAFAAVLTHPGARSFFELDFPSVSVLVIAAVVAFVACVTLEMALRLCPRPRRSAHAVTMTAHHSSEPETSGRRAWLPPRWFVVLFWHAHRALVRLTGGRVGLWRPKPDGWGALWLTTVGRRTGRVRKVLVGYFEDGDNLVTMAMNGWGAPEPAWWLNLQEHPEATVQTRDGARTVHARQAHGPERERLWARWGEIDANLDAYADRRPGETAVVVFEPRPPGAADGDGRPTPRS